MVEFIWFAVICIICLLYPLVPAADRCAVLLELGNHSPHHPAPEVRAFWLQMTCLLNMRVSPFTRVHILRVHRKPYSEACLDTSSKPSMKLRRSKTFNRKHGFRHGCCRTPLSSDSKHRVLRKQPLMLLKLLLCSLPPLLLRPKCSRLGSVSV